MAGLDPAIHVFMPQDRTEVDASDMRGRDELAFAW